MKPSVTTTKPEDKKYLAPVTYEIDDETSIGKHCLVIDIDMCSVRKNDQDILEYSVSKNHMDLLKILTLDEESPKKIDGKSLLHVMAAAGGNSYQIENLLSLGVNVNLKDESGRTGLHYVALNTVNDSHYYTAEVLFKEGANLLEKDKEGRTPMDLFFRSEQKESNPRVRELFLNYMTIPIQPLKIWLGDCEENLCQDDWKIKKGIEKDALDYNARECAKYVMAVFCVALLLGYFKIMELQQSV